MSRRIVLLLLIPFAALIAIVGITTVDAIGDRSDAERLDSDLGGLSEAIALERAIGAEQLAATLALADPGSTTEVEVTRQMTDAAVARCDAAPGASRCARTATDATPGEPDRALVALREGVDAGVLAPSRVGDEYARVAEGPVEDLGEVEAESHGSSADAPVASLLALMRAIVDAQTERAAIAAAIASAGSDGLADPALVRSAEGAAAAAASSLDDAERVAGEGSPVEALRGEQPARFVADVGSDLPSWDGRPPTVDLERWLATSTLQLDGLYQLAEDEAAALTTTVGEESRAATLRLGLSMLLVAASIVGLVLILAYVRRSVIAPLRDVSSSAQAIAAGDVTVEPGHASRGEIGQLAAAFRSMQQRLSDLVSETRRVRDSVRSRDLSTRADVERFDGAWKDMLEELNETVDEFAALHGRASLEANRQQRLRELSESAAAGAGFQELCDQAAAAIVASTAAERASVIDVPADELGELLVVRSVHGEGRPDASRLMEAPDIRDCGGGDIPHCVMLGFGTAAPGPRMAIGVECGVATPHAEDLAFVGLVHQMLRQFEQRIEVLADLRWQASHDSLTLLPNRPSLEGHLDEAVAALAVGGQPFALLVIDLDRFKLINDDLGHEFGDHVLVEVAERLASGARPEDVIARFGGDEFVAILPGVWDEAEAMHRARAYLTSIEGPLDVGEVRTVVGASAGLVTAAAPDVTRQQLLRDADTALYQSKAQGGGVVVEFHSGQRDAVVRRHQLERLLGDLEDEELSVLFQPIVETGSGEVVAAEALARWHSTELGSVPPLEFIRIAEETGRIVTLGERILALAVAGFTAVESRAGREDTLLAVNVSAIQLRDARLPRRVDQIVSRAGLAPERLILELTESAVLHDAELALRQLSLLREIGVAVALDDFGTGYSSLSHLTRMPVDYVKIDGSIVRRAISGVADRNLLEGIVSLSDRLGIRVIAEGIETQEQRATVDEAGCALSQGYLFAGPLSAGELQRVLTSADAQ